MKNSSARASDNTIRGSNSVVECNLAKVEVEGSNPFSRSILSLLSNPDNLTRAPSPSG